jgi:hypothetical protein
MCEWLKGFGDDMDRPDKTKIVLDFISPDGQMPRFLQIWEVNRGSLRRTPAKALIAFFLKNSIPVALRYLSGKKEVMTGGTTLSREVERGLISEGVRIINRS